MPVLNEQAQDDQQTHTLADKKYPFKSLVPCDLRQFTRRYKKIIDLSRTALLML